MFAAGALLVAALLHIVPEALPGLSDKYDGSIHDVNFFGNLLLLTGITIGIIIHAILEATHAKAVAASTLPVANMDEKDGMQNLKALMQERKGKALFDFSDVQPVCYNIIIGDFVHNIADGVAIGTAFLGCNSTVGWTVTASVILHETPHEIADFMALINGGMSMAQVSSPSTRPLPPSFVFMGSRWVSLQPPRIK